LLVYNVSVFMILKQSSWVQIILQQSPISTLLIILEINVFVPYALTLFFYRIFRIALDKAFKVFFLCCLELRCEGVKGNFHFT